MRKLLFETLLLLAVICFAAWIAILVAKPGPEGKIVLASGGADGAYDQLAQTYRKDLERYGVKLELRPEVEGIETLKSLFPQYRKEFKSFNEKNADIQGGFIKGGFAGSLQGRLASAKEQMWHGRLADNLRSVGRVFDEPLWVFSRASEPVKSLRTLKNKKLYVGTKESGTRRVAVSLLKANGVDEKNATLIDADLPGDGSPLISGEADAALLILPPESPKVQALLRNKNLQLMDFSSEADAYTNRFPSLSKVILRQGAVEFDPDIPAADITLLTTSAAIVVRKDMNPALVSLLAYAVMRNPKPGFDKTGEPILFYEAGQFPNGNDPEFALAPEARLVYKANDLPLLLRSVASLDTELGLPFWPAAVINAHAAHSLLLLIPLLSVALPLMRVLPLVYTWSVRRRLLYWYRQLKLLEASIGEHPAPEELAEKGHQLDRIDAAVSHIRVPLNFSNQLYDLRGHIDLVRLRLAPRSAGREWGAPFAGPPSAAPRPQPAAASS